MIIFIRIFRVCSNRAIWHGIGGRIFRGVVSEAEDLRSVLGVLGLVASSILGLISAAGSLKVASVAESLGALVSEAEDLRLFS